MTDLEGQVAKLHQQKMRLLESIDMRNKHREIECGGCEDFHEIGDLIAIQTHWYVSPHGCIEGAYWKEGELQFVCPQTDVINRLLFDDYDTPWEERSAFSNNPEKQFKNAYKHLFRKVQDNYDERITGAWVNNFYVDENREQFGLVVKRT